MSACHGAERRDHRSCPDDAENTAAVAAARVTALTEYDLVDTRAEACFDGIVSRATDLRTDPMGLMPSVTADRRWFQVWLMLHERATNALRYGAVSNPDGRGTVEWRITGKGGDALL